MCPLACRCSVSRSVKNACSVEASPPHWWIITADSAEVERLRALHQLPAGYHNRRGWTDGGIPIDTPKDKEPATGRSPGGSGCRGCR